MTDAVVTDQAFGGVAREHALAQRRGLTFAEYQCRDEDATTHAVRGAQVVFVNFAPITRRVLAELAPGATVIRYGIGYDNVDLDAARELGVRVANVPDYGVATVADHTVALLLTLLRRIPHYDRGIRSEDWVPPGSVGALAGLADSTVGLVGSGRIGTAVIERLRPFGCEVLVHDPYLRTDQRDALRALGARSVELIELLGQVHALSLHLPLTPQTHHLIDAAAIDRMRSDAVIVNTARGGLIDTLALGRALQSGQLAGAALDVFEQEPLPPDAPLRAVPGVVLTPHAAFYSDASLAALQQFATEEADRALSGNPLRSEVTR